MSSPLPPDSPNQNRPLSPAERERLRDLDQQIGVLEDQERAVLAWLDAPPPAEVRMPGADEAILIPLPEGDLGMLAQDSSLLRVTLRAATPRTAQEVRDAAGERAQAVVAPLRGLSAQIAKLQTYRRQLIGGTALLFVLAAGLYLYRVNSGPQAGSEPPTIVDSARATLVAVELTPLSSPTPIPTVTLPPPSPTALHGSYLPPDSIRIQVADGKPVDLYLRPARSLSGGRLLIYPPDGQYAYQYGPYPQEGGNTVILGRWEDWGPLLAILRINDRVPVTIRTAQDLPQRGSVAPTHFYIVTACDLHGETLCPVDPAYTPLLGQSPQGQSMLTIIVGRAGQNYYLRAVAPRSTP